MLVRKTTVLLTNEHGVLYIVKETLNKTKLYIFGSPFEC